MNYSLVKSLKEKQKIDTNFYVNFATYQSTFVDKNNEEYIYTDELILCNKVPSLYDCVNAACIKFYANKDTVYKRGISIDDLTDLSYVYSMLKKVQFFCL